MDFSFAYPPISPLCLINGRISNKHLSRMVKLSDAPDFKNRQRFPGETGNVLDAILHSLERIEKIPSPLFALLLLALAIPVGRGDWLYSSALWLFFLLDWLLLFLLPKAAKSYGPAKPPAFLLALLRCPPALLPVFISIPIQIIGTFLVIYAFWIEPHRIRLTHQKLITPRLRTTNPLRILHLGDLHIERITAREQELLGWIERLQPDLILFSGDILNLSYLEDPQAWQAAREVLSQWKAPLGVYLVNGSPAVDKAELLPELLKGLPIHWLDNDKITLKYHQEDIDIIGVSCSHRPYLDREQLARLAEESPSRFTILLYHSPDLAPIAAQHKIDLQLSGHTHGGQVRLPWFGALLTGSLYGKQYEAGRRQIDGLTLYVSRGIGLEGAGAPRVRFLCPPEIILWEISSENRTDG